LDFIDADGVDLGQRPVFQTPGDDVFDGIKNLFPGSTKRFGGFFPRKAASPTGQEEHVRLGQGAFAVASGNFFDDDGAAAPGIDAAHGVQEEDQKSPEGDELKASLGQLVVTGGRLMAARTDRGRAFARPHRYFDTLVIRTEPGALIDKSAETMAAV
jgi:hypothetical protein